MGHMEAEMKAAQEAMRESEERKRDEERKNAKSAYVGKREEREREGDGCSFFGLRLLLHGWSKVGGFAIVHVRTDAPAFSMQYGICVRRIAAHSPRLLFPFFPLP